MATVKRRVYRSTIRRGEAHQLVIAAAARLFATRGYLATSIEDIAAEAGVARPTIFSAVGPKAVILRQVVDQAIAGDDAALSVSDRSWWREAVDEPDPCVAIQRFAQTMTQIGQRIGPIARALETAATADGDAAQMWERYQDQRRVGLREFAEALTSKRASLRCDVDTMTDTLWMLQPTAYLRLVIDAGWSVETYETWLADLLCRLFLE